MVVLTKKQKAVEMGSVREALEELLSCPERKDLLARISLGQTGGHGTSTLYLTADSLIVSDYTPGNSISDADSREAAVELSDELIERFSLSEVSIRQIISALKA